MKRSRELRESDIRKIETLIEIRINGNSIKGNKTYENMLKNISVVQLVQYADQFGYQSSLGWYKKIDIIEDLVNQILK